MKHLLVLLFTTTITQGLLSQDTTRVEKKYYTKVIYKKTPHKKVFKELNDNDKKLQKESVEKNEEYIGNLPDSIIKKHGISEIKTRYKRYEHINNRSRIYFNTKRKKGVSFPCNCFIKNDTLTIGSAIRFFGGYGFASQLYKDEFTNYFMEYSDEDELKLKQEDSNLKRGIEIDGIYQKLILESKPKLGETLTGYFSILTKPYYRKEKETKVYGEVYFKCLVLQYQDKENNK